MPELRTWVCTQCGLLYAYEPDDLNPQVCPDCGYDDPFFEWPGQPPIGDSQPDINERERRNLGLVVMFTDDAIMYALRDLIEGDDDPYYAEEGDDSL